MRRHRRRAFSLVYLIVLLPLLGAAMAVAVQLTVGIFRLQGGITRQLTEDTRVADLVRRMRHDLADVAWSDVSVSENGQRLTIRQPDGQVVYDSDAGRIRRSAGAGDEVPSDYEITFSNVRITFRPEHVGTGGKGIVWIGFDIDRPAERGPELHRRLAAAVRVGRGGES